MKILFYISLTMGGDQIPSTINFTLLLYISTQNFMVISQLDQELKRKKYLKIDVFKEMATMGRNLRLQPLVIYHCKGEGPTIHRWYLVGIGGHRASGKLRLKKVIFEN